MRPRAVCLCTRRAQETSASVRSALVRVGEAEAQLAAASELSAATRADLGDMAEALGAAFQQVRVRARVCALVHCSTTDA